MGIQSALFNEPAAADQSEFPDMPYRWARESSINYEVSSKGDKRFSALIARLKDGRTIEEAYQLDVKGYRIHGDDWKLGKGKPSLITTNYDYTWNAYKALWQQWANENPTLIAELADLAKNKTLTDMFGWTSITQARALAEILNERKLQLGSTPEPEIKKRTRIAF